MAHSKTIKLYLELHKARNTKIISSIIEERFLNIRHSYEEHNSINESKDNIKLDPLSGYLENENLTYNQLVEFIKSLGNRSKKPFREYLTDVSKKLFDRRQNIIMIFIFIDIKYIRISRTTFYW